mmetsp:Transcript_15144/g.34981  ORF Transcript_15144/g.34981 Transcript_15144/m.34981 type:complete len:537 (-) Transcript_15144:76-1686(-)
MVRASEINNVRSRIDSSDTDNDLQKDRNIYKVKKSRLISLVNWYHVISTSFPYIMFTLIGLFVFQFSFSLYQTRDQVKELAIEAMTAKPQVWFLGWQGSFITALLVYLFAKRPAQTYLLEFCTFEAPEEWKVTHSQLMEMMRRQQCFSEESINFLSRILDKSGTGPATAWPPSIVQCLKDGKPQNKSVENAREESMIVICKVIEDVLAKTKTKPRDIDILVINCSLFSPTPSLCALAAHHFGMRSDLQSYNLAGMGCSASVIAVDLAKDLLNARGRNGLALVVSTENLTQNLYLGNDRSMLLQNTLFRCGGAAMLLSNSWAHAHKAKYKLLHTLRKQGIDDESYECVFECEDENGNRGVRLSKQIVKVAGRAMEQNFTALGPYVLPVSEIWKVAKATVARPVSKLLRAFFEKNGMTSVVAMIPLVKPYIPDFKRGIDHFCIHAGGRAVVDGVGQNLKLDDAQLEPSRHTLYHYGNTSSSSIWYELDHIRKSMNQRRGHRVLQLAFGSGFKCNSAVWLCLQDGDNVRGAKAGKDKSA